MKHEGITAMDTGCNPERREFLRALTLSTAALSVGACTSQVSYTPPGANPPAPNPGPGNPPPPPTNQAPVWQVVPNILFTQGVATSISITPYVLDPNGDALTITKNAAALPAGVTFDAVNKRFVYDGIGAVASTSGHVLTADDGRP
jgi:hypothetical protein